MLLLCLTAGPIRLSGGRARELLDLRLSGGCCGTREVECEVVGRMGNIGGREGVTNTMKPSKISPICLVC
jgi:hypothetical protein